MAKGINDSKNTKQKYCKLKLWIVI